MGARLRNKDYWLGKYPHIDDIDQYVRCQYCKHWDRGNEINGVALCLDTDPDDPEAEPEHTSYDEDCDWWKDCFQPTPEFFEAIGGDEEASLYELRHSDPRPYEWTRWL